MIFMVAAAWLLRLVAQCVYALNPAGKAMLIKYVLKAKLNQNAKMRLEKSYTNVETLL